MFLNTISDEGKKLFYNLELILANSDENYDSTEEALIKAHCTEMGYEYTGKVNLDMTLNEVISAIHSNLSTREKKIIFIELVSVALVDGEYHENEKKLIEELRSLLCIPEEVANDAIELIQELMKITNSLRNFVEW